MSERKRPDLRRWLPWVAGAAAVLAAIVVGSMIFDRGGASGGTDFPAPLPHERQATVSHDDFVGSDECEECHKHEYDLWKHSTHGNAGGLPGDVRIIAPFDGVPIRFADAVVTPRTDAGQPVFHVREASGIEQVFEVAGVVGGGHMVGGGTQAFFAEFPDGTYRFLPFDYIRQEEVWFCQTAGRADSGWAPITPDLALAACNDWPPNRVLGASEGVANCQQCHGSQITVRYDFEAKNYETRFTTLAINCESCHGPGSRHIEIADSDSIDSVTDIGVEALATLDKDGSLQVCFQCHAVKAELQPGYISGEPLEDYFSDLMLLLSYRPYFPDGRIRVFAYQQQHLYSDCYLNGSMTCVDCHDPHSQRYRDIWWEPLVGRFSDGQCLDCHPSKATEVEVLRSELSDEAWEVASARPRLDEERVLINSHTYHPVGAPGGRCIDCHMPYLQEPDVGQQLRYSRSDHTIPIPRPGLDAFFGIENACVKCHGDLSLSQVQEKVQEWYGELKPPKSLIRGLIEARGVEDRNEAARLMLMPEEEYVPLLFTNLAYFNLTYLTPDMPALEEAIVDRLMQLAQNDDPDLQALALASLHLAHGSDPAVRQFLAERLRRLDEQDWAIRRRWVWVLSFRGDTYSALNQPRLGLAAYQKAAEILPGNPEVLRNLGVGYGNAGDLAASIRYLRESLEADPNDPNTMESLAVALSLQGEFDAAIALFTEAIDLKPDEARLFVTLGNTLIRAGNVDSAIESFRRALTLDPSMAVANFTLAAIYIQQDRRQEAITALQNGLSYDPSNARALEMLADLQR